MGIQDMIIIQIKKVIQELGVVRKIMNKPFIQEKQIRVLQEPLQMIDCMNDPVLSLDYDNNDYDEDTWGCQGMGRWNI